MIFLKYSWPKHRFSEWFLNPGFPPVPQVPWCLLSTQTTSRDGGGVCHCWFAAKGSEDWIFWTLNEIPDETKDRTHNQTSWTKTCLKNRSSIISCQTSNHHRRKALEQSMGPFWMLILWRPRSIPLVVTRPFNWFLLLVVWVYYSGWLVHGFQEFNFLLVFPLRYDYAKPAATCSTLFQLAAANSCVSQVWEWRCPKTLWCHLIQFRIVFFFGVRPQLIFGELNQNLEDNICGFQFSCLDRPSLLRHGNRRLRCAGPLPLAKRRPTRWCSFTWKK